MAEASDRTIPATARRREAARRAGLAAPADLPAWAASAATAIALGPWWARTTLATAADGVRETFTVTLGAGAAVQAWPLPLAAATPTLVVVAAAAAAGLAVRFACDGFSWQPGRAAFDLRRIDPVAGLARLCSWATLTTFVTAATGLTLVGAVAVAAGRPLVAVQAALPEPGDVGPAGAAAWRAVGWVVVAVAAFALAQWLLARRRLERSIRMTLQELAEEQREMQADPRIRLMHQRQSPRPARAAAPQQAGTS